MLLSAKPVIPQKSGREQHSGIGGMEVLEQTKRVDLEDLLVRVGAQSELMPDIVVLLSR